MKSITLCNCILRFLLVFLPVVSWALELQINIPDFENLSVWRTKAVSSGFSCKNWYKNWYLHFQKINDHQIRQADPSTGIKWDKSNRCWWRRHVKVTWQIKNTAMWLFPPNYYESGYGHQTWQSDNLPCWAVAYNVTWTTKLGRMLTNLEGLLPILLYPLVTWSCEIREKLKSLYFYYHCAYCHQTCRMVTNIQGFLAILLNPLVTWTWEFAWETKNIYSPRQCQWPPNLAGWGYIMRSFLPYTQTTILSRDIVRSRKVLDQLYLYYFKD